MAHVSTYTKKGAGSGQDVTRGFQSSSTGPGVDSFVVALVESYVAIGVVTANRARLNFDFLNNLIQPFLATATVVDVGLQRDRLLVRADLGRKAAEVASRSVVPEGRYRPPGDSEAPASRARGLEG
jgi:hypothetical protein